MSRPMRSLWVTLRMAQKHAMLALAARRPPSPRCQTALDPRSIKSRVREVWKRNPRRQGLARAEDGPPAPAADALDLDDLAPTLGGVLDLPPLMDMGDDL